MERYEKTRRQLTTPSPSHDKTLQQIVALHAASIVTWILTKRREQVDATAKLWVEQVARPAEWDVALWESKTQTQFRQAVTKLIEELVKEELRAHKINEEKFGLSMMGSVSLVQSEAMSKIPRLLHRYASDLKKLYSLPVGGETFYEHATDFLLVAEHLGTYLDHCT